MLFFPAPDICFVGKERHFSPAAFNAVLQTDQAEIKRIAIGFVYCFDFTVKR